MKTILVYSTILEQKIATHQVALEFRCFNIKEIRFAVALWFNTQGNASWESMIRKELLSSPCCIRFSICWVGMSLTTVRNGLPLWNAETTTWNDISPVRILLVGEAKWGGALVRNEVERLCLSAARQSVAEAPRASVPAQAHLESEAGEHR